ncbi:UDP-xylose and UDP-N-acetylglucosamine transporter [Smittium culicis]|uniref:UDP-xylose and UDP-N-acetylglucosamine transporter n=1 Tax=Smittium culicis TaxID=133412 RepID=A0A1R1YMQ5_9FUNG|nr:UDP-xylose and UDP-N-acetylglucosamine transporter [Smittium culicis]
MAGVLDIVTPNLFFSADIIFSLFMITGGCCGNVLILEDFLSPLSQNTVDNFDADFYTWTVGVALLAASVVFASMLGLYQESVYKKYNGNWKESLFYLHFLALPFFTFSWSEIAKQSEFISHGTLLEANLSPLNNIASVTRNLLFGKYFHCWAILGNWPYLIAILFSQVICTMGVNYLSLKVTSLTLNLVLTLRKLISLFLSFVLFENNISFGFGVGCFLAISGAFLYVSEESRLKSIAKQTQKKDKNS